MALYYLLSDIVAGGQELQGGTMASTADAGGVLPVGWAPCPDVDPMDAAAIFDFFTVGPQQRDVIRTRWTQLPINPPKFVWQQNAQGQWSLSGMTQAFPAPVPALLVNDSGTFFLESENGTFLTAL